jgi:hypothetical protein
MHLGKVRPDYQRRVVRENCYLASASLCSAPTELDFDPLLSRFELRSFPQPDRSDVGMIGMLITGSDVPRRNGTKRKFLNDFSRARMRVRARRGGFRVSNSGIASRANKAGKALARLRYSPQHNRFV